MKKFSNITNQKIGEDPKVEVKINEEDLFKTKVLTLMEQLLTIRTYGPIDRYLRAGNIKISGQDMFVEALLDLLKDKSSKEEVKLYESLKGSIQDWELLDNKIEEANNKIEEIKLKKQIYSHRNKIKSIYESYKQDEEFLLNMIDEYCKKITKQENAHLKSLAASYMANDKKYPTDLFNKISEKFKETAQKLCKTLY